MAKEDKLLVDAFFIWTLDYLIIINNFQLARGYTFIEDLLPFLLLYFPCYVDHYYLHHYY